MMPPRLLTVSKPCLYLIFDYLLDIQICAKVYNFHKNHHLPSVSQTSRQLKRLVSDYLGNRKSITIEFVESLKFGMRNNDDNKNVDDNDDGAGNIGGTTNFVNWKPMMSKVLTINVKSASLNDFMPDKKNGTSISQFLTENFEMSLVSCLNIQLKTDTLSDIGNDNSKRGLRRFLFKRQQMAWISSDCVLNIEFTPGHRYLNRYNVAYMLILFAVLDATKAFSFNIQGFRCRIGQCSLCPYYEHGDGLTVLDRCDAEQCVISDYRCPGCWIEYRARISCKASGWTTHIQCSKTLNNEQIGQIGHPNFRLNPELCHFRCADCCCGDDGGWCKNVVTVQPSLQEIVASVGRLYHTFYYYH